MYSDLLIAIGFSQLTACCFTSNSLISRHYIKNVKFNPIQLNIDGCVLSGCVFLTFFIFTEHNYSVFTILEGILVSFF